MAIKNTYTMIQLRNIINEYGDKILYIEEKSDRRTLRHYYARIIAKRTNNFALEILDNDFNPINTCDKSYGEIFSKIRITEYTPTNITTH